MEVAQIQPASPFEVIRKLHTDESEFWSARELAPLLGYTTWEQVPGMIERAIQACDNSGQDSRDHFRPSSKKVLIGSGANRTVLDYHLTRYGAYLVAMNGDPRKPQVAAAQSYFAVRTREAELRREVPEDPILAQLRVIAVMRAEQLALSGQVAQIEQRLDAAPITSEKVGVIYRLAQQLGQVMGNYRAAWRLFKDHYQLASYRDLPSCQYDDAVRFLRVQISAYTGQPAPPQEGGV